jgi:hypothetical protein
MFRILYLKQLVSQKQKYKNQWKKTMYAKEIITNNNKTANKYRKGRQAEDKLK